MLYSGMQKETWELFRESKLKQIFSEKNKIVDIGGGLRIDPKRNNRARPAGLEWIDAYLDTVDYVVMDKVADYNPDVVGDIHDLPFEDNSVDAIICMAVLEHVEEPQKAVKEMYRVLKPGGYCFIYAPFLFFYHPMEGYYSDYYRFTRQGFEYMTRDFKEVEIQNVMGATATVMNLFPFFTKKTKVFQWIDRLIKKSDSDQTSAYDVFCIK